MSCKSKNPVFFYREFVETALTEKPRNLFQKVYGVVILGGKKFIEEVLDRLNDQDVQKKEISHRRFLGAITSDMDEIVDLLCNQLKVSREQVQSASPYKGYAVYLAGKHTPFSNPEIGRYFGGISYSAITKIGTRTKDRMKKNRKLREEMIELQKALSRVKG